MKFFCLMLVATMGCYGAAPETGAKKMREVVRLPTIDCAFGLKFQSGNGWTLSVVGAEEDSTAEIATLRKELKGDISDAERFTRLRELYAKANDKTNLQAAAGKALEIWRRRVELQPDNGHFLAELGRSLAGAEKYEEAESVLRKATRIAPGEWKCWIALGTFLDAKAHRALALAPSSDLTMDLLVSLHVREARFDDLLPLCEERVKRKDTSRNRSVLAKVYDKLNQTEKAEDQLSSILKKEPDHVWANLALASLLLKRGHDESVLRKAEGVLKKTRPLLEKADTSDTRYLQVHYVLTTAVLYGLTGANEAALAEARKVLSQDQENDYAQAVLAALGTP